MRGVRPIATRTSSATTRPPSERASTAFFSVRCAAVDLDALAHRDAELLERRLDELGRERLHVLEQPRAHQQRDLGAEARVGRGHLGGDHAAADDGERGRNRLARSWHRGWSTARSRAARGCRAAERAEPVDDRDRVARDELGHRAVLGGHPHALDAGELGVAADEVDAGLLEPLAPAMRRPSRG